MHHYQQQHNGEPLVERVTMIACRGCGAEFRQGNNKVYCTQGCRERAKFLRAERVPCAVCGGPTGWRVGQSATATHNACLTATWEHGTAKGYRVQGCRCEPCHAWMIESAREFRARRESGELTTRPCIEDGCDRGAVGHGLCKMHYRRVARAEGRENPPSNAWSDTRRSNYHARRARKNGSKASDKVIIADLISRGATICQWCQGPIDLTLVYPHRYSKSLDHTLPLVLGGTHTVDNCTLMHLTCNLSKGTQEMGDRPITAPR